MSYLRRTVPPWLRPRRAACAPRAALALLGLWAAAAPATDAPAALPVTQVAPGVFVHLGKPLGLDAPGHDDIANIGFVVGARCVAVIDSGGSMRVGDGLRAALRQRSPLPVCYLINTHVHVDHVLGNAAFRDEHPQFVGHAGLAAALARSRDFFLQNYAADLEAPATATEIIGADRGVEVGPDVALDLGGRRLKLRAWPKAHSDCDLTVYDEATGTLFTGDLLFVGRTPVVDGSIKGWVSADESLAAVPVKHVVPGHGAPGTDLAAALAPQQRYLDALLEGVRTQLALGKPLQDALRDVQPDKSAWLLFEQTHPRNVARVYQELEWE